MTEIASFYSIYFSSVETITTFPLLSVVVDVWSSTYYPGSYPPISPYPYPTYSPISTAYSP